MARSDATAARADRTKSPKSGSVLRTAEDIEIVCEDDYRLRGHLFAADASNEQGMAIINPATAVLAKYYHPYASFLAERGFSTITFDYRGIGLSRPSSLRSCGIKWRDWGELDFAATVRFAKQRRGNGQLVVIGHSIGGFLPGYTIESLNVDRFLFVGGQYAHWRDYRPDVRLKQVFKWHLLMPLVTAFCGYFPAKRLGWFEDLPASIANEWSFRGQNFEDSYPARERSAIRTKFATLRAPILAIGASDDEIASPQAIERALSYFRGSHREHVTLTPDMLNLPTIGHFSLFHSRNRDGFWTHAQAWLERKEHPWAAIARVQPQDPDMLETIDR